MNGTPTCTEKHAGTTQSRSCSVRYELLDKDGYVVGGAYDSREAAMAMAKKFWPGQPQDQERTGLGWDLRVEGCQ